MPAGKKALLINLDETAVCLFQGTGRGTVVVGKKRKRDLPVQRVNRAIRRTYLTHAALICDNPLYQKHLPQVVVGNEHTLLVRDMPGLQPRCPRNFTLIRQKSAWNNVPLMCSLVGKLAAALAPYASKVQPILLMDAAKLHWAPAVMNACRRKGVWPIPVPAKLTWLLQPCDTHLFQRYKLHLRKAYQQRRQEAAVAGALGVQQLLDCIYEATEHVVEDIGGWKSAFLEDGFGARQALLSEFRKSHLELDAAPKVGDRQPSMEQVQLCFPRRQRVPTASQLFGCPGFQAALPAPKAAAALPAPSGRPRGVRLPRRALLDASAMGLADGSGGASSGVADPAAVVRREPRTRSEHRLAALAKASAPGA